MIIIEMGQKPPLDRGQTTVFKRWKQDILPDVVLSGTASVEHESPSISSCQYETITLAYIKHCKGTLVMGY